MALRQSGIDLVMRGATTFFANLGKIQTGYNNAGVAADNMARKVQSSAAALQNALLREANAVANVASADNRLRNAINDIDNAQARLQKVMANTKHTTEDEIMATNRLIQAENNELNAENGLDNAQRNLQIAMNAANAAADKYADSIDTSTQANANATQSILQMVMSYTKLGQTIQQGISIFQTLSATLGTTTTVVLGMATAGVALAAIIGSKLLGAAVSLAKTIGGILLSALKAVANAVQSVIGWFLKLGSGILRSIGDSIRRVFEIFLGVSLANKIQEITDAIRNMASEVVKAVADFQQLEIRLNSLLAKDYAQAFGGTMTEALGKTTGATQELFDWMRKLAVQTPFDMEEIANVLTMSEAMGITGATAQRLTESIINFTSAMGLTGDTMWRIIYNFGQMIQRGKLSGEEFRDLARNFVPIDLIMTRLAEKAGMTKEAFRDLALKGGVPVMAFLEEFMTMTEKDWAGAALRMSKTFEAVQKNLKEFIKLFIGMDVLKPVLDRITASMADFLDKLMQNQTFMNSMKFLGQALLQAFNALVPAVDALMRSFGSLATALGFSSGEVNIFSENLGNAADSGTRIYSWAKNLGVIVMEMAILIGKAMTLAANKITEFASSGGLQFQAFVEKVKQWGYNLIVTFINGIATGLGLLAKVMATLGNMLAGWLESHSPPNIAPNVDQWGADLMNEFFKGFLLADFSMFDDVAGLMESFFRSISDQIGGTNGEGLIPRILGSRAAIAESLAAVRAGTMTVADAVQKMVATIGEARPEFTDYITALFDVSAAEGKLAAASQAVKVAQDAVNAVSAKYEGILSGLRKQLTQVTTFYSEEVRLREINEAMSTQLLTDEERERLEMEKKAIETEREIRTVEEQRDAEMALAEANLAAAQAQQEAAQYELDTAKQRAEALQKQIELMIEQNKLLEEQKKLLEELQTPGEGEGDTGANPPPEEGGVTNMFDDLTSIFEEAQKKADALWGSISNLFSGMGVGGELGTALGNLKTQWEGLGNIWANLSKPGGTLSLLWDKIQQVWQKVRDFLGIKPDESFLDWMITKIGKLASAILLAGTIAVSAGKGVLDWLDQIAGKPIGSIAGSLDTLFQSIDKLLGVNDLTDEGKSPTRDFLFKLSEGLKNIADVVVSIMNPLDWLAYFIKSLAESLASFADVKSGFVRFWEGLTNIAKVANGETPVENIKQIIDYLIEKVPQFIKGFGSEFTSYVTSIISEAGRLFLGIGDEKTKKSIPDTLNTIGVATENGLNGKGGIVPKWEVATGKISGAITTMGTNVTGQADGVTNSVGKMLESLSDPNVTKFVGFTEVLKQAVDPLQQSFQALADSIWDAVNAITAAGNAGVDINNLVVPPGRAAGGPVAKGSPYLVGERGPEIFYPKLPGIISPDLPKVWQNMMASANPTMSAQPVVQNIDRSTHINVNANYANQQSEADIYYDVTAALAAMGR